MLVPDPVVKMILHDDDVGNRLTITAILEKLNGNLDAYPPPLSLDPKRRTGMWGRSSRLGNPAQPEVFGLHGVEQTVAQARRPPQSAREVGVVRRADAYLKASRKCAVASTTPC